MTQDVGRRARSEVLHRSGQTGEARYSNSEKLDQIQIWGEGEGRGGERRGRGRGAKRGGGMEKRKRIGKARKKRGWGQRRRGGGGEKALLCVFKV